ncbi:MAG: Gfo/Idh/MocA family oxidoreductase [Victivallaceae bacterium]|nr:Gfo/Idh/MocA family oxidoreductase [Victivallaceae bacterium]
MKALKFVIVGSGNISNTYCQAINKIANAELTGIISRGGKRPPDADDCVPVVNDLSEITCDYDAVIVATPNGLHNKWTIKAAEAGKHVLTEKPLDISRAAMTNMIDACKRNNVLLGVCYQYRSNPDIMILKELLEQGSLGKVIAADYAINCWRDQSYYDSAPYRGGYEIDGGGPFIQQACHQIDLYAWFFGKPCKVLSMLGTFLHDIEGEDHGVAILKHSNGMIGTITASTCAYPGFEPELMIVTDKGSLILKNTIISDWNIKGFDNPSVSKGKHVHSGAGDALVEETGGHESIICDFIEAVRQNRPPMVSGEDARAATEIVLDIYENNQY